MTITTARSNPWTVMSTTRKLLTVVRTTQIKLTWVLYLITTQVWGLMCNSYSKEFTSSGHNSPQVGSCSGDCHLLATNLNSNKFHKEFLWSNCARMCSDKYNFNQYKLYKPRFICMEKCYNSYKALAPHHSLARYCIKASCPDNPEEKLFEIDCFSSCSQHVSSSVAETDWQKWATALAGNCQRQNKSEKKILQANYRLTCADQVVWDEIITSEGISAKDQVSNHCLLDICQQNIKCGRTCLSHVNAVEKDHRLIWIGCSKSIKCIKKENPSERLECADECLKDHREEESKRKERKLEDEMMMQDQHKQQALSSLPSYTPCIKENIRTVLFFVLCLLI